jgi:hypothetical protein
MWHSRPRLCKSSMIVDRLRTTISVSQELLPSPPKSLLSTAILIPVVLSELDGA